jgi:hypothetical protein
MTPIFKITFIDLQFVPFADIWHRQLLLKLKDFILIAFLLHPPPGGHQVNIICLLGFW